MSLFSAQLVRDWTGKITPNLRRTFVSVNDAAGWWIYQNTQKLSAVWTRVWESDGTTGPASDVDNTQRLVDVAACSTRGANTSTAQSWGLYVNSDGVQFLICYTGASDDVIRLSYSPGGNYARAGTATFPPTATDEVVISQSNTIVHGTASLDRAITIWCHDQDWRCAVFRNGALVRAIYLVEVETLTADSVFGPLAAGYPAYVAGHATSGNRGPSSQVTGGIPLANIGSANDMTPRCRVFTNGAARNIQLGAGEIPMCGVNTSQSYASNPGNQCGPDSATPALQGNKTPMMPIFWSGEAVSGQADGYLGVPRDWRLVQINSLSAPSTNDFLDGFDPDDVPGVSGGMDGLGAPRTNWWTCIAGPCLTWPWRDVAASVDTGL